MPVKWSLWALALLFSGCLQAGPVACVTGTLASYEALLSTGCTIGSILVENVTFNVDFVTGTATALSDTQITVTPGINGAKGGMGLSASGGPGFSVTGTGAVEYLIAYTWDPSDDISSADDVLDDPVTVPGALNITTNLCIGAAFVGTTCPMTTATLSVFDIGTSSQLNNTAKFTATNIVGFRNFIDLAGNGTGAASFTSLSGEVTVPEPATWMTAGAILMLVAWRMRRAAG